jgi:site-specific DNA recombinase
MGKWREQIEGDDVLIKVTAMRFIGIFKEVTLIDEFDVELLFKLVEKIIVLDEGLLKLSLVGWYRD